MGSIGKSGSYRCNHIDNNSLNNHYKNLEWCTDRENINHGNTFRKTSSNYPGVCRFKEKWQVRIEINGQKKFLGYFKDEEEAAEAYQTALNLSKI